MWISRRRREAVSLSKQLDAQIAALFAAGEQGGWWDPSDLSTLFQDTAGTTPVTASGQSVARINDKSGRGNHLIQATAGARPLFLQSGGLSVLQLTGAMGMVST